MYKENSPTSKMLIIFLFFNMANLLQVMKSSAKSNSGKCDQNPQKHPSAKDKTSV